MVTGNMIGSGIFLLSGYAASSVSGGPILITAWVFGGFMALFGALSTAELATRMPQTGGDFLYLREGYGPFPAFLYGWMSLVISMTGSIAILALFSAEYLFAFVPSDFLPGITEKLVAYVIIVMYTVLHILRVTIGARIQSLLTVVKIALIFVLVSLLISSPAGDRTLSVSMRGFGESLQGFSLALIPIFFTYSGWNVVGYMAGEVSEPKRTLPIALVLGTVITIALYVLLIGAFLHILPIDSMRNDPTVPLSAIKESKFSGWAPLVNVLVLTSVISSLSIAMQSGARIYQAMAESGVFFRRGASLHKRFGTPVTSLIIQGLWSIVLIHFLPIRHLVDSVTVVMVLFSALTISTLFKARKKARETNDENKGFFKTPLYPLIPAAYIASCLFISIGVIQFYFSREDLIEKILPFAGFGILILGSIMYLLWRRKTQRTT